MVIGAVISVENLVCSFKSLKERRKAEKDVTTRKQSGKNISGSARAFSFRGTRHKLSRRGQRVAPSEGVARTVVPAETRSPMLTASFHSGPKITSTLDPNLMYPIRSPA